MKIVDALVRIAEEIKAIREYLMARDEVSRREREEEKMRGAEYIRAFHEMYALKKGSLPPRS